MGSHLMSVLDKHRLYGLLDDNFLMPQPYSVYPPYMRQARINQMGGRNAQYDDFVDYMRRPGLYPGYTAGGVPTTSTHVVGSGGYPRGLAATYGTIPIFSSEWNSGGAGSSLPHKFSPSTPPLTPMPSISSRPVENSPRRSPSPPVPSISSRPVKGSTRRSPPPPMPSISSRPIKSPPLRSPSPSFTQSPTRTPSHSDDSYPTPYRHQRDHSRESSTVSDRGDRSHACSWLTKGKETPKPKADWNPSKRHDPDPHAETRARKSPRPERGRESVRLPFSGRFRNRRYDHYIADDLKALDPSPGDAFETPFVPNDDKTTWRPWTSNHVPDADTAAADPSAFTPQYEVICTPDHVSVYVVLAGATREDIDVTYDAMSHELHLYGQIPRPIECLGVHHSVFRRGRDHGLFDARVALPGYADEVRDITATHRNGLLSVVIDHGRTCHSNVEIK